VTVHRASYNNPPVDFVADSLSYGVEIAELNQQKWLKSPDPLIISRRVAIHPPLIPVQKEILHVWQQQNLGCHTIPQPGNGRELR
jgi:hypothetical protein